jgi:hypothetical protein
MQRVIQPPGTTSPDKISLNYRKLQSPSNLIGYPWIFCRFWIHSPLTGILVYRPLQRTVYLILSSSIQYKLRSHSVISNGSGLSDSAQKSYWQHPRHATQNSSMSCSHAPPKIIQPRPAKVGRCDHHKRHQWDVSVLRGLTPGDIWLGPDRSSSSLWSLSSPVVSIVLVDFYCWQWFLSYNPFTIGISSSSRTLEFLSCSWVVIVHGCFHHGGWFFSGIIFAIFPSSSHQALEPLLFAAVVLVSPLPIVDDICFRPQNSPFLHRNSKLNHHSKMVPDA